MGPMTDSGSAPAPEKGKPELRRENAKLHAQVRGLTAQVEAFLGIKGGAPEKEPEPPQKVCQCGKPVSACATWSWGQSAGEPEPRAGICPQCLCPTIPQPIPSRGECECHFHLEHKWCRSQCECGRPQSAGEPERAEPRCFWCCEPSDPGPYRSHERCRFCEWRREPCPHDRAAAPNSKHPMRHDECGACLRAYFSRGAAPSAPEGQEKAVCFDCSLPLTGPRRTVTVCVECWNEGYKS